MVARKKSEVWQAPISRPLDSKLGGFPPAGIPIDRPHQFADHELSTKKMCSWNHYRGGFILPSVAVWDHYSIS